jgi:hypothetical protein
MTCAWVAYIAAANRNKPTSRNKIRRCRFAGFGNSALRIASNTALASAINSLAIAKLDIFQHAIPQSANIQSITGNQHDEFGRKRYARQSESQKSRISR